MIINSREQNGITVFDIFEYEEERDLALICDLLARKYTVDIKDKLEGPGATIWDVQ